MGYMWLRHPRTTAERRANEDGWCRSKRNPHRLPQAYDDIVIRTQRSWKSYRKTQWKPK